MNNNKNHNKTKRTLRIVGLSLFLVGLILCIIGFIDLFKSMIALSGTPKLFFLLFIGMPFVAIGASMLLFSLKGALLRFGKNEAIPVINEASEEVTPAVKAVSEAVKGGYVACPHCGAGTDAGSRFCKHCGHELAKACPNCGNKLGNDAKFCDNCGTKL